MMPKKSGRSVLIILSMLLASGGVFRLASGAGIELWSMATAEPSTKLVSCPLPPAALLDSLAKREAQVKAQETAAAEHMAALNLSDQAITQRMAELQTAEEELKKTLTIADGASEKDLAQLTAVYEAMKPADAAALFQTMSPDFAAGFLARMQPGSAADIMTGLKPETAYEVSVLLAGRNALVPKN
jgi:flagellar motility protein MotE (MotC chaperone)